MPSDLSPALMTTTSVRTSTTVPLTMAPCLSVARLVWLCSNSSANDSVIWKYSVDDTDRKLDCACRSTRCRLARDCAWPCVLWLENPAAGRRGLYALPLQGGMQRLPEEKVSTPSTRNGFQLPPPSGGGLEIGRA